MENKVLDLYYIDKYKQKDIANELNISVATVSRIVRKDARYIEEKNSRMCESKVRHNKDIQQRVEKKRKVTRFKNNNDDLILKEMHRQASQELSKVKHLSDENYRKWNSSAYRYNPSRKRYEFDENLGRSYDVPKYIKER